MKFKKEKKIFFFVFSIYIKRLLPKFLRENWPHTDLKIEEEKIYFIIIIIFLTRIKFF